MGPYLFLNALLVGFFGFAALHYFWYWWLSRRERVFLVFAAYGAVCSLVCTQLLVISTTDSVDVCRRAMDVRVTLALLAQPLLVGIYTATTGLRARTFQAAVIGVCALAVAVNLLVTPVTGAVVELSRLSFPWGEAITFPRRETARVWVGLFHALILSVSVFGLAGATRLWRRDRSGAVLVGSVASCALVYQILSILMDVFGAGIRLPFLGVVPNAIFVVFMSVLLSREHARRGREIEDREHGFRALVEQASDGILLADLHGRCLDANPAACLMFGYERERFSGLALANLMGADERPRLGFELTRLLGGAPARSEWRFVHRDGAEFWGEVHGRQLPDGRLLGFVRDVSARKRSEEQLAASEARYRAMIESAPEAIIVLDTETRTFVDCNRNACDLFGAAGHEMRALGPADISPPNQPDGRDSGAAVARHVQAAVAGEQPVFEWVHRARDGRDFPCEVRLVRLPDPQRVLIRGSILDITARKRGEETLRESEFRHRLALDAARMGTWDWDVVADRVSWDDRQQDLFGFPPGEYDGHLERFYRRLHPDDAPAVRAEVARALETGCYEVECRFYRPSGELRWLSGHGRLIRDPEGRPVRMIGVNQDITARRQADETLREAQEFSMQVLASTRHGVVVLDRDLCYRMWNSAMEEMTGLPASAVLGRAPQELFPFLETEGVIAGMRRALAGEVVHTHDFPYRIAQSGRAGWSSQILGPVRTPRGEIVGVLSSVIETTARREVQDENRRLLNALGERVKELTCLHRAAEVFADGSTDTRGWVEQIVRILPPAYQYPIDAVARVRHGDFEAASPGFALTPWCQRAEFTDAAGGRGLIEVAYLTEHPDEAEGPFLVEERALLASLADMLRVAIDRRLAEQALRAEKLFIDTLMDALPGIVFLLDAGHRHLKWNRVLEEVTGYAGHEIARMAPFDFFDPADADTVARAIRAVFADGRDTIESAVRTRDRRSIPYYFKGVRLVTEHGPCLLGIGLDISDRRRLEEQFRQAQKMEAVGRLAGGVAHDFNNLLTVINGYADLLLSGSSDPDREPLTLIRDAGDRAAQLTKQLLAFSRKAVLEPRVIELNRALEHTAKLLRRLIGEDIVLVLRPGAGVPPIRIDPGQLEQVVMNLAVNARDAMPTGGTITIETRGTSGDEPGAGELPPGTHVRLMVSDTGHGMTDEVKARLFEPFFTTKGVGKGTGLGLAVVHGAVKQSGGHIRVESMVGVGTTFHILFPSAPADRPDAPLEAPRSVGPTTGTVLLVEDETAVRAVARAALEVQGFNVLEADGGAAATQIARDYPGSIDLMITDVVMPGVGGRQLASVVQGLRPGLPVLYMSGYTDDAVIHHGVASATDVFIQKPFTPLGLVQKTRMVLAGRNPHGSFSEPGDGPQLSTLSLG